MDMNAIAILGFQWFLGSVLFLDCTNYIFKRKSQEFGTQVLIYFGFSEINIGSPHTYNTANTWFNKCPSP